MSLLEHRTECSKGVRPPRGATVCVGRCVRWVLCIEEVPLSLGNPSVPGNIPAPDLHTASRGSAPGDRVCVCVAFHLCVFLFFCVLFASQFPACLASCPRLLTWPIPLVSSYAFSRLMLDAVLLRRPLSPCSFPLVLWHPCTLAVCRA